MRRIHWFEAALTLVFLSATFYAAFSDAYNLPNRWFIRDDAYYYYKVAQNISAGMGSTFDGVHPTNGYHPLWMAICIPIFALAKFDLILPLRILAIVTGILQLGTAILIHRLLRSAVSPAAGVLGACFWAFNTYVLLFLYKTGVESAIATFLTLVLLYALQRFEASWRRETTSLRPMALFGALAVLIAFARLDLAFFSIIIGIWIVFRKSPMRYLMPLDILGIAIAGVAAFVLRLGFEAYRDASDAAIVMLAAALATKIPVLYFLGGYERPSAWTVRSIGKLALATTTGSALLSTVVLGGAAVGAWPKVSLVVLLLDMLFTFTILLAVRAGAYVFRSPGPAQSSAAPTAEFKANWRVWLREGAVFYGVFGAAMALYMLWNKLAFGTFSPVSGQIKQWWGTFTHSIYGNAAGSWLTFLAFNPFSDFNAWAPATTTLSDWTNPLLYFDGGGFGNPKWQGNFALILLGTGVLILAIAFSRSNLSRHAVVSTALIPLFVGAWLQILAYNIPGYASPKEWYWLLEPVALVLAGGLLFEVMWSWLGTQHGMVRLAMWSVVAWFGLTGAFGYWRDAIDLNPYGQHAADTPYSPIIPFLEANTPPGALIGMTGGGNVGYLMRGRTIVNMDGLINSYDYFEALKEGTGADYLYDSGMRYVFANRTLLDANPYRGQFSDRLELMIEWGGKDLLRLLPPKAD